MEDVSQRRTLLSGGRCSAEDVSQWRTFLSGGHFSAEDVVSGGHFSEDVFLAEAMYQ